MGILDAEKRLAALLGKMDDIEVHKVEFAELLLALDLDADALVTLLYAVETRTKTRDRLRAAIMRAVKGARAGAPKGPRFTEFGKTRAEAMALMENLSKGPRRARAGALRRAVELEGRHMTERTARKWFAWFDAQISQEEFDDLKRKWNLIKE